jgi:hypothetical protein
MLTKLVSALFCSAALASVPFLASAAPGGGGCGALPAVSTVGSGTGGFFGVPV